MAKSSIIEPEVLPSNVHRVDISTSGGHLAGIAEQLRQDVAELELKKQEATWLALRIGMMLLQAKKDVEHGQYEEWVAAEVPQLGRSQAGNYRRLAEAFIEVNELPQAKAVALLDANPAKPGKAGQLVQMAFDFLGNKTLNEIFVEHGIKKPVENRGGARAGAGRPSLSPADRAAIAQGNWQDIYAKVIQEMKTRSFVYLERAELENLDATLMDLRRDIAEVLKGGAK
jgi:hypothetical protein